MMLLQFDPGSISKTLNLSLLLFIEQSGFQNHAPPPAQLEKLVVRIHMSSPKG